MLKSILGTAAIAFLLMHVFTGCDQNQDTDPSGQGEAGLTRPVKGTIVAVGDSITAGLGVDETFAYPALIQKKLAADGYFFKVVNAGISGETSSGTLSRVNWVISSLKPDMVILVIGANDGMRGIDPNHLRKNLDQIISILKEKDIQILLGAMKMLPNLGPDYAGKFERVYPEIAAKNNISLIPFFLKGVAGETKLNQPDGIHPTAEGYSVIADHIYPYILDAVLKLQP